MGVHIIVGFLKEPLRASSPDDENENKEGRVLSSHDQLLLRDLKLQPIWLLWLYVALGVLAACVSLALAGVSVATVLGIGGGFLVALGAEKIVTRRIRFLAARLSVQDESSAADHV